MSSTRSGIRAFPMEGDLPSGYRPAGEGEGSYFALPPRQAAAQGPALDRRGTTKDLIGRFESMERGASVSRTSTRRHDSGSVASSGRYSATPTRETEKPKEKGRSPIRQSFRNLLSVFKKSKPAAKELPQAPAPTPVPSLPGTRYKAGSSPSNQACVPSPATPGKPSLTLQIPSSTLPQTDPRNCISPISAHTGKQGPLLYLSRVPGPSGDTLPPVWMSCLAQLHTAHILVSWSTAEGNPTSRLVPFTACSDVRSLALGDLREEERALLPEREGREVRVFELLFEGRAREKFAAEGVAERAGWVSAIWDAVLHAQESRVRSPAVSESVYTSSIREPIEAERPLLAPSQTHEETFDDGRASTASRIPQTSAPSVERALPDIPAQATEKHILPRLDLRNLPPVASRQASLPSGLSPLPAPPTTPTSVRGSSFLTPERSNSPSRTPSPSIRNLDQRSVVKQRLAQIAQSTSARSASPVSPSTRRWELRDSPRMQRQDSRASSTAASILNSYARTEVGSPQSPGSGRLTTLPPSPIGSPPPQRSHFSQRSESGGGRFLGLPLRDDAVFSPASRYSDDETGGQGETRGAASQVHSALDGLAIPLPPSAVSLAPLAHSQDDRDDETIKPTLENIREGVEALKGRSATDSTNLVNIRTKVDEVLTEVRRLQPGRRTDDSGAVTARLEAVGADIRGDLSKLQSVLEGLRNTGQATATTAATPDLSEVQEKLDGLLRLCQSRGTEQGEGSTEVRAATNELADILALLKDAEEQRVTQMEQQTDSIRYLNELNTWLEAFVKHGTSQIEGVAAGVQQLCQDLGPVPELQDAEEEGDKPPAGNLLSDIRTFLVQHKERQEDTAALHTSVNGLIAAVQEDLRRNAEARNILTTESVIGMIDRQRQDQERMLKALATELGNDIRGERLRFVEAMKEATAINVQSTCAFYLSRSR
ncbi:hypothetical protein BV20DRAFT_346272 [Pilatotrama ljubarskyi]|nr:hypothetical protein BV20DRAFT_346272 [Pilatotrama ljubarskyi]